MWGPPGAGWDHPLQPAVGKTGPGSRGSGWRWQLGAPWRGCGLQAGDGRDPRQGATEGGCVWAAGRRGGGRRPPGRPPRLGLQNGRWQCCPRLEGVAGRDPELRARPQPRAGRGLGSDRIPRAAWCLNGGKKSFEAVFSHRAHMSPFLFVCWFLWGQRAAVSALGEGASGSLQGIKHFAEPGRSGGPEKATWGGVSLLLQGLSRGCGRPV